MSNAVHVIGDLAVVSMVGSRSVVVDATDLDLISGYRWSRAGGNREWGTYPASRVAGTTVYMHRVITDAPKGMDVDHINHDAFDNRRANLRVVTHSQNMLNRRNHNKNSGSGLRGVYKQVQRRGNWTGTYWSARVQVNGKHYTKQFPFTDDGRESARVWVDAQRAAFAGAA